ncbi:MAG: DUF3310 domain-containing protein [Proteobacteria bacterium]|nr:DUF3310 domain-containing protein [Pseudomonadota bacterium]
MGRRTDVVSKDDIEVIKPPHYTQGKVECIHAIKASLAHVENGYDSFLKANVMKYLWRMELKGAKLQNIQKALFYLRELEKENLPADYGVYTRREVVNE